MGDVERLVEAVRHSANYRTVSPELITHVGRTELARRRTLKEAVKATKSKLHQTAGSYLRGVLPYSSWLDELRRAREAGDEEDYLSACKEIMQHHSSTRERLPILSEFYVQALRPIAPVRSVLDVACGLNPLSIPWMPIEPGAEYWAYDVYEDMIAFLGEVMKLSGVVAHACCQDVTRLRPKAPVDLALMLKVVPCLDQLDRSAASRLLDTIDAHHFLISFPVRSLGGRAKGMVATYEARMERLLAGRSWQVRQVELATELAFLVSR